MTTTESNSPGESRATLKDYNELVAFSHSVFALPFAASAVVLSLSEPHLPLSAKRVIAMLVCMVSARTSAMAFNRFADRDIDAENPRTKGRPVPSGRVTPKQALSLTVFSGLLFIASAATLGTIPMILSVPVLLVLLGYSLAKRFTWAAHAWLGVALSLAPGGAWIGMGAAPNLGIVCLMVGVLFWLFGFDILYSLQDEHFDRERGLHSVPARFGLTNSLIISGVSHVVTVLMFVLVGVLLGRGGFYFGAVGVTAVLLFIEHWIVGKGNLEKINKAFFDVNAYVSVGFFVFTLADELWRHR